MTLELTLSSLGSILSIGRFCWLVYNLIFDKGSHSSTFINVPELAKPFVRKLRESMLVVYFLER